MSNPLLEAPKILAAAPHRMLFLIGALNVLLAMAIWLLWLIHVRWGVGTVDAQPIPPGWLHAIVMQYQVFPPFMFGFLLTVFPRWMNLPSLRAGHYMPVAGGLLIGQLITLVSVFVAPDGVWLGLGLTLLGWCIGLSFLLRLLWQAQGLHWHAMSCAAALSLGAFGLLAILLWPLTGQALLPFISIKIGSFGLLLPVYFTVCHRMLPFFSSVVVPGYVVYRPMWTLGAFWFLCLSHLALELVHAYAWSWLPDLGLAALSGWLLWRWRIRVAGAPALLRVLHAGFAWLPLAMALYAVQSIWFAISGEFSLGRAPAHALYIGFFGSLLVAMVTRVTQGHSGRPLVLTKAAIFAFLTVQCVAIVRIAGELQSDAVLWQSIAASLWLIAFLPWVAHNAVIYLVRRQDGKPG